MRLQIDHISLEIYSALDSTLKLFVRLVVLVVHTDNVNYEGVQQWSPRARRSVDHSSLGSRLKFSRSTNVHAIMMTTAMRRRSCTSCCVASLAKPLSCLLMTLDRRQNSPGARKRGTLRTENRRLRSGALERESK